MLHFRKRLGVAAAIAAGLSVAAASSALALDITGTAGNDTVRGGEGDDRLWSGPGRDVAWGGPGNDRLFALVRVDVTGPGDIAGDSLNGEAGDDRIWVRDGERDVVTCGTGFDRVRADLSDQVAGDCERVRRRAPRR